MDCRRSIIRSSTHPTSVMARRRTSSSCAWKHSILSLISRPRRPIWSHSLRCLWWRWSTDAYEAFSFQLSAFSPETTLPRRDGLRSSRGRLPAGHAQRAEDDSAARLLVLCRWPKRASSGGEHRGSRAAARRQLLLHRSGAGNEWLPRRAGHDAFPGHDGSAQARPGAVQYLLHALPLARGQRAGRNCVPRLQAGGESARPSAHVAAHLALLLRDDARLWRHAGLLRAAHAVGSLGSC